MFFHLEKKTLIFFFDHLILLLVSEYRFFRAKTYLVELYFKFTSSTLFWGYVQACQLFSHFASVMQTSLPGSRVDRLAQ